MSRRSFLKTLAAYAAISCSGNMALAGQSFSSTPRRHCLSFGGKYRSRDGQMVSRPVVKVIGIGHLGQQVVTDLMNILPHRFDFYHENNYTNLLATDVLFLIAGTESTTVLTEAARLADFSKSNGTLTVAILPNYPFQQGSTQSLDNLSSHVDSLIITAQEHGQTSPQKQEVIKSIAMISQMLCHTDQGIFADVHDLRIALGNGLATVSHGAGRGRDRAFRAAHGAISGSTVQNRNFELEQQAMIIVSASRSTLNIQEIKEIALIVSAEMANEATIFLSSVYAETADDQLVVTVLRS